MSFNIKVHKLIIFLSASYNEASDAADQEKNAITTTEVESEADLVFNTHRRRENVDYLRMNEGYSSHDSSLANETVFGNRKYIKSVPKKNSKRINYDSDEDQLFQTYSNRKPTPNLKRLAEECKANQTKPETISKVPTKKLKAPTKFQPAVKNRDRSSIKAEAPLKCPQISGNKARASKSTIKHYPPPVSARKQNLDDPKGNFFFKYKITFELKIFFFSVILQPSSKHFQTPGTKAERVNKTHTKTTPSKESPPLQLLAGNEVMEDGDSGNIVCR